MASVRVHVEVRNGHGRAWGVWAAPEDGARTKLFDREFQFRESHTEAETDKNSWPNAWKKEWSYIYLCTCTNRNSINKYTTMIPTAVFFNRTFNICFGTKYDANLEVMSCQIYFIIISILCFFSELWLSFPVGLFLRFPLHFVCFIFVLFYLCFWPRLR